MPARNPRAHGTTLIRILSLPAPKRCHADLADQILPAPSRRHAVRACHWRRFAAPAHAGVQVEVRGVGDDNRANVLVYLSFERYKDSDDLSPEFVERLQERSEREVRARVAALRILRADGHARK